MSEPSHETAASDETAAAPSDTSGADTPSPGQAAAQETGQEDKQEEGGSPAGGWSGLNGDPSSDADGAPPSFGEDDAECDALGRDLKRLVDAVYKGDLEYVQSAFAGADESTRVALTTTDIAKSSVKGALLHHAICGHRKRIIAFLFDKTDSIDVRRSALFLCTRYCKYDIALYLVARLGGEANYQRESDGNSVLHCVCSKAKPPIAFLAELCKLKMLKVNQRNHAGMAPVHLLAANSTGVEGKDACTILKAKGALLDLAFTQGGTSLTPLQMTRNSYLRETLNLGSKERRRGNPLSLLSDAEVAELDSLPVSRLPKLKAIEVGPLGKPAPLHDTAEPRSFVKKKRIRGDEEAELVNRLYSVARAKQEELSGSLAKRFLESSERRSKRLSPSEQDESVERLFGSHRDDGERTMALYSKYVVPADSRTLPRDCIQDSVTRLYNTSLERSKDKQDALLSKYLPTSHVHVRCGGRKLSPDESLAANKRLYSDAVDKQKSTLTKLKQNYLTSDRPVTTMSNAQWKVTSERLHARG